MMAGEFSKSKSKVANDSMYREQHERITLRLQQIFKSKRVRLYKVSAIYEVCACRKIVPMNRDCNFFLNKFPDALVAIGKT
jgi:hypothetical protein